MKHALQLFMLLLITLFTNISNAQSHKDLLNEAIYLEEVSGDLEKSISILTELIKSNSVDRKIMAEALLHLGLVHEKLGNQKAESYYRQLISSYPDQKDYTTTAQSRLGLISALNKNDIESLQKKNLTQVKLLTRPDIYGTLANDGKFLSYVNWDKGNLALQDMSSGKEWEITEDGTWGPEAQFSDMSIWSPDNQQLAYLWLRHNAGELRIYDVNSKKTTIALPITNDKFPYPIAWTTDFKLLVNYVTFDRKSWTYYLLDPTSGEMELLDEVDPDQYPKLNAINISPSGKYLAYVYEAGDQFYANIVKTGDRGSSPIDVLDGIQDKPFWSHDEQSIFYVKDKFGNRSLFKSEFSSGRISDSEIKIIENLPQEITSMTIDAQAENIHYTSSYNQFSIFQANIEMEQNKFGKATTVIDKSNGLSGPSWSPDGNAFAYISTTKDNWVGSKLNIKNTLTGENRVYNLPIKLLEVNYFLTNIHWTPDGNHILVTYHEYEDDGNQLARMALVNVKTEKVTRINEDIVRGTTTLLSEWEIIFYEKDNGLVLLDRRTGNKKSIFASSQPDEVAFYPKRNTQLDKIVFYRGQDDKWKGLNELVLLDLKTGAPSTIWKLNPDETFMYGNSPHWIKNDKSILVPVRNLKDKTFQFYSIDLETASKTPFGKKHSMDSAAHKWIHTSLNPKTNTLLYLQVLSSAAAWSINNI